MEGGCGAGTEFRCGVGGSLTGDQRLRFIWGRFVHDRYRVRRVRLSRDAHDSAQSAND